MSASAYAEHRQQQRHTYTREHVHIGLCPSPFAVALVPPTMPLACAIDTKGLCDQRQAQTARISIEHINPTTQGSQRPALPARPQGCRKSTAREIFERPRSTARLQKVKVSHQLQRVLAAASALTVSTSRIRTGNPRRRRPEKTGGRTSLQSRAEKFRPRARRRARLLAKSPRHLRQTHRITSQEARGS